MRINNKSILLSSVLAITAFTFQNCAQTQFKSVVNLPGKIITDAVTGTEQASVSQPEEQEQQTELLSEDSSKRSPASISATQTSAQPQPSQPVHTISDTDFNARNFLGCAEWDRLTGQKTVCAVVCNRYTGEGCQNTNPAWCIPYEDTELGRVYRFHSYADNFQTVSSTLPYFKEQLELGSSASKQTIVQLAADDSDCRSYRYFDPYLAFGGTTPDGHNLRGAADIYAEIFSRLGFQLDQLLRNTTAYVEKGMRSCYPIGRADCSKPEI